MAHALEGHVFNIWIGHLSVHLKIFSHQSVIVSSQQVSQYGNLVDQKGPPWSTDERRFPHPSCRFEDLPVLCHGIKTGFHGQIAGLGNPFVDVKVTLDAIEIEAVL